MSTVSVRLPGTLADPGWLSAVSRNARKMDSVIERLERQIERLDRQRDEEKSQALRWLNEHTSVSEEGFAQLILTTLEALNTNMQNDTKVAEGALRTVCEQVVACQNQLARAKGPDGHLATSWIAHQGRVLRAVMATLTVVDLATGAKLTTNEPPWTRRLKFPKVFDGRKHLQLVAPENEELTGRIIADQTHEAYLAVTDLTIRSTGILRLPLLIRIVDELDRLCALYGRPRAKTEIKGTLLRKEEACDLLGCTQSKLETLVDQRKVVSVTTWTGDVCFPDWQFENRDVCPIVKYVLDNTPDTFSGWSFALFLSHHYCADKHDPHVKGLKSFFKKILKQRALWQAGFTKPPNGSLAQRVNAPRVNLPANTPLYRVQRRCHKDPYFFTTYNDQALGSGVPSGTGRLDLPKSSGYGTLYVAETPLGSWSEVLGHVPVLTLDDIFDRVIYEIRPKSPIPEIADEASGRPDLITNNSRQETCSLAHQVRISGSRGIRYGLAARQGEVGYALFGKIEGVSSLRTGAGLGVLTTKGQCRPAVLDEGFWTCLKWRDDYEKDFPVLLRRFPDREFWKSP